MLIYLFYRFLFGFIIPLFTATKQMKDKMQEFQRKMEENQTNYANNSGRPDIEAKKAPEGDYIEYEEVKD